MKITRIIKNRENAELAVKIMAESLGYIFENLKVDQTIITDRRRGASVTILDTDDGSTCNGLLFDDGDVYVCCPDFYLEEVPQTGTDGNEYLIG